MYIGKNGDYNKFSFTYNEHIHGFGTEVLHKKIDPHCLRHINLYFLISELDCKKFLSLLQQGSHDINCNILNVKVAAL